MISRLVLVHFDPPTDFPGIGQNYRACDPTKYVGALTGPDGVPSPWHAATGDPTKVTCEDCQRAKVFRLALARVSDEDGESTPTAAALARLQPA